MKAERERRREMLECVSLVSPRQRAQAFRRFGLDKKPPEEQDAQDHQDCEHDDFYHGHGRFLDTQRVNQRKIGLWNFVILGARCSGCQRTADWFPKLYGSFEPVVH